MIVALMRVADFIALMDREVTPQNTKIHLASWNGSEDPLDVYRAGGFDEWQNRQTRRNFERPFVIGLISLGGKRWLYAGTYDSNGCDPVVGNSLWKYSYRMQKRESCSEFNGRLVATFDRPGRQSYLNLEGWADQLVINEILREPLSIGQFPGFKAVDLSKIQLDAVVAQEAESWRAALSNVAGVYLISDTTSGKLYVGSATGEGGIWQRWCEYSANGHGGNRELRQLIQHDGERGATGFRFSILEIADTHASTEDILRRESHWKKILLARSHGLNAN
jgi:GIY-YIG catalytic domain